MTLKTIRQTAATGILPEYRLRQLQKQKKLPGIYSGNRFLVDVDLLKSMLSEAAARNAEGLNMRERKTPPPDCRQER